MCNAIKWSFAAAYTLALFLLAVDTWGWLSDDRDPLSGLFLIPLGMPWTLFIGPVGKFGRRISRRPRDARTSGQLGHPFLDLLHLAQTTFSIGALG